MKAQEREQLLRSLKSRFEKNPDRHREHTWERILAKLEGNAAALESLGAMEASGGEPDVIGYEEAAGCYLFCDCSAEFDLKTSSWVATPEDVRSLGGALFCDRRYGKVFVYHNGAQSYYAARGFRGLLRV